MITTQKATNFVKMLLSEGRSKRSNNNNINKKQIRMQLTKTDKLNNQ